jgi:hypothetical protein
MHPVTVLLITCVSEYRKFWFNSSVWEVGLAVAVHVVLAVPLRSVPAAGSLSAARVKSSVFAGPQENWNGKERTRMKEKNRKRF